MTGQERDFVGDRNLALLLSAGTGWPPQFLAGVADDIYKRERSFTYPTTWNTGTITSLAFTQDYGHGDALVNALHALGLNKQGAQLFFAPGGTPDADKLSYLIKTKQYGGIRVDQQAAGDDAGSSLGLALAAATDPGAGPASGALTKSVLDVIAHGGPRAGADGALQPPAMRPFTSIILGHYMHDVDTTLAGGRDQHDPIPSAISLDRGTLETVLGDTMQSDQATGLLSQFAQADIRHTLLAAANGSGDYGHAIDQLHHLASNGLKALGELHNIRTEIELHHAEVQDENNEAIRFDVTAGLHIATFLAAPEFEAAAVPIEGTGLLASLSWDHVVGPHVLPTDNALHVREQDIPSLERLQESTVNDPNFANNLAGRLKYLYEHSPKNAADYTLDYELNEPNGIFGQFTGEK